MAVGEIFFGYGAVGSSGVVGIRKQGTIRYQALCKCILDNITVDGINLGGMTWEEGRDAVRTQARDKQSGWYVLLKTPAGDSKYITAETLGISFDPTVALQKAWAIGHDASETNQKTVFERWEEIERMKSSSAEFFSAEQNADTSIVDAILNNAEQAAYIPPHDAAIIGFDPNNTKDPFTFQVECYGQQLNTSLVKEQILHMVHTFQSGEILLEPETIYPGVTVEQLKKSFSRRARAVTPIAPDSTAERTNNIRVAFSKINGMTLKHGKKFSFNGVVGRRTLKNRFFEANEYAYGELVVGVGGGVCQASTTIYLAAVQAGMTVLNRKPHSNPVSYTDVGMDATVSDTKGHEIDFVFRNDSGDSVYIFANVIQDPSSKKRLLCEVLIYGLDMGNVRYALETEIVQRLPKPGKEDREYVQDTKATYVTFTDEEKVVIKASEGCVVDSYISVYVDGVQTERKKVDRDTYPNRRERVYVGVTPRW